ncbi:MAG: DUF1838 family protein [Gammaproteobacteria bacterium]
MLETLRRLFKPADEAIDEGRRSMLTAVPATFAGMATGVGMASAASLAEPLPEQDGFISFASEQEKFRALFRLERDLRDQGTTFSTYQFITYALPQGARPQPIVRWEGMEFSYFRRVSELTWRIHAHNVSYPRDLHNGQFVTDVRNPFTGQMLDVEPMKLLNDPGVLHGPQGYLPLDAKSVNWLSTYHVLRTEGALIKSEHIRPTPDGWPTMFIESSCSTVTRKDFMDHSITALPYQTAGFYVFPFPAWMRMGDRPGHMLGAWSGRRAVAGSRDLPREFRERVARENPELLEARWGELERPLSPMIKEALQS